MSESIRWPIRLWIACIALNIAIVLSIGVILSDRALISTFVGLLVLTITFSFRTTLYITVSETRLRVGKAQIEAKYIKCVEVLDDFQMRQERGAKLDPRAFLALRFWIKSGVKVTLDDQRDPTPYWLISSKQGKAIKDLLKR